MNQHVGLLLAPIVDAELALARYDQSCNQECDCDIREGPCEHSRRDDYLCRACIPPLRALLSAVRAALGDPARGEPRP